MPEYRWKQIEPLSADDRSIDLASMAPLYATWKTSKDRLQKSSPSSLETFNNRLIRRLNVETGILERLYDIDRGTTEALVSNGFAEELVARGSTDIEPSRLIDILRDHDAAIQLVMDCIKGNRVVSKGVIHDLHVTLTKQQATTFAVDQFGDPLEIPLLKGKYKIHPNNPKRPDGSVHEYCPPDHVDTEMEQLLHLLEQYRDDDPIIVTSWFHHRFTQIHPYQDGNGRVARALTTYLLIRSDLLPLVIDRDLRTTYIDALESADFGDLSKLATLFAQLERAAILEALSVDIDAEVTQEGRLTTAVIQSLAAKFSRRRESKDAELREVNNVAIQLRSEGRGLIESALNQLRNSVIPISTAEIFVQEGGPDSENSHWYKFEVIQTAKNSGKYANFNEHHYFVKATVRIKRERITFVTSLHHVGRDLSGIMEATTFARLESFEDSDDRESVTQDFFVCSLEPFVFTYQTNVEDIVASFGRWLDESIAIALKEYGDRL